MGGFSGSQVSWHHLLNHGYLDKTSVDWLAHSETVNLFLTD